MHDIVVSQYFLDAVTKYAAPDEQSLQRLLVNAGIQPPQRRIGVGIEQFAKLQAIAVREMNDEMLGYGLKPIGLGSWSALNHWVVQAHSLGQVFRRISAFYEMIHASLKPKLIVERNELYLRFSPDDLSDHHEVFAYEMMMLCLHRMCSWLVGRSLTLKEARFDYHRPDHWREYHWIFSGAKCVFSQDNTELVFDRNVSAMEVNRTVEELDGFMRQSILNMTARSDRQTAWSEKTRRVLRNHLTIMPSVADIAEALHIHPKKLSRRLESEGLNFSTIKNQVRRDAAIDYLLHSSKSIEEIAYLVGYTETCTFTRAFRKWTHLSPLNYRKQSLQNQRVASS